MTTPAYPTSQVPPSPLTLSQALSSAFAIMKQRFGMFLGLVALMFAALVVIGLIVALPFGLWLANTMGPTRTPSAGQLVSLFIGITVMMIVMMAAMFAVQVKVQGMLVLLAHETALGRRPSMADLNEGTKGIMMRALALLGLLIAAAVALMLVISLVMTPIILGSRNSNGAAAASLMGLVYFVVMLASIYLSIRFFYTYQALAIERSSGIDSLKRSWNLTAGEFWRTLGWYLVCGLVIMAAFLLIGLVSGVLTSVGGRNSGVSSAFNVIFGVLIFALEVLTTPFILTYQTVMYVDQVRRKDPSLNTGVAAYPGAGNYPGAAGYAAAGGYAGSTAYPGTAGYSGVGGPGAGGVQPGSSAQWNGQTDAYGQPGSSSQADAYGQTDAYGQPASGSDQPIGTDPYANPDSGTNAYGTQPYGTPTYGGTASDAENPAPWTDGTSNAQTDGNSATSGQADGALPDDPEAPDYRR